MGAGWDGLGRWAWHGPDCQENDGNVGTNHQQHRDKTTTPALASSNGTSCWEGFHSLEELGRKSGSNSCPSRIGEMMENPGWQCWHPPCLVQPLASHGQPQTSPSSAALTLLIFMIKIIPFLLRKLKPQIKFINVSIFLHTFQSLISQKFIQGTFPVTELSVLKKQPRHEKPGMGRVPLGSFHLPSSLLLPPADGSRRRSGMGRSSWKGGRAGCQEQCDMESQQGMLQGERDGHERGACGDGQGNTGGRSWGILERMRKSIPSR